MKKYSAYTIANWFINRSIRAAEDEGGDKLTLMKLLKLLYYAEGCALAIRGIDGGIFDEDIVAWEHGPVVAEIYSRYCSDPFELPLSEEDEMDAENIEKEERDLLEQVFDVFGQYSASGLRNKTHSETPWLEATDNGTRLNRKISRDTMLNYFKEHYVEQ